MNLQLIKSENFGEIQCDIYSGKGEFYMTREQIGRALEYSQPRTAITKMHIAREERFNNPKFSVVTKLVSTDGKAYNTTVYTRKGIMEICRHSQQPKADAFMDWVWEVMDGLITGKTKLVRARPHSLTEINNATKLITGLYERAGVAPQFQLVAVKSMYASIGIDVPFEDITVAQQLFEPTEIARKLGIVSRSGKPHAQAVGAIIAKLPIEEGEREPVPFSAEHGHFGTHYQYAESMITKIICWLEQRNYPSIIEHKGKNYTVTYDPQKTAVN